MICAQRELNRLTLRQFAALAGVSNPYLSQIERGLRAPSEDVLRAIARSLKMAPDELIAEAGLTGPTPGHEARERLASVLHDDPALSPRQVRVLLDVYAGLVATTTHRRPARRTRADGSSDAR